MSQLAIYSTALEQKEKIFACSKNDFKKSRNREMKHILGVLQSKMNKTFQSLKFMPTE